MNRRIVTEEGVSGVVAGFTAKETSDCICSFTEEIPGRETVFCKCYPRVVTEEGSKEAQKLVENWMEACDSVSGEDLE